MCGIAAYAGKNGCVPYLISGLKALEYRGYDSAGIVVQGTSGLEIIKAVGKVAALEVAVKAANPVGTVGIAHTRWATHGKPSEENSHPHTDCKNEIAVIHNGIIENFLVFKKELASRGHIFQSETDTEVIAHLLEDKLKDVKSNYEDAFLHAVHEAVSELTGSYAFAILWKKTPNMVIGTKKRSPLVVGVGNNENFMGSDISAFQSYTNRAIYLDDSDIAVIRSDSVEVYDEKCTPKKLNITSIEQSSLSRGKNGLEHYMLKEIREQPETVASTISSILTDIDSAFAIAESELRGVRNIMLVGCGTAYHAALTAKYWMEEFTGIPAQAELASEYKYRKVAMPKETLAVFVSQSGETADTVSALEKAKAAGFKTIAICNVYGSTISRISDYTFYTKCGAEVSVASTKAFTAQLASLFALSILIGKSTGALSKASAEQLIKELSLVPTYLRRSLEQESTVNALAERYYRDKSFVFLGRNVNYPIALEGALKLKEITYLQAEGFAAGEIKHGPIALISVGTPVIAIAPKDRLFDKMNNACEEVMARGAEAVAITDEDGNAQLDSKITKRVVLPNTPSYLFPIVCVSALQLFAYRIACLNGREVDQPRNLAKSVTVE